MRIPFVVNQDDAEPLKRIVFAVAKRTNTTPYMAATFMSYFLEELACEVAKGNAVSLPGFGLFAPVTVKPKFTDKEIHASPRFSASRVFRQEVAATCTPYPVGAIKWDRYIRSHRLSSKPYRSGGRVFTAQRAFRDRVRAQAVKAGIDV